MFQQGDAQIGNEELKALERWEDNATSDFDIIKLWPTHNHAHEVLLRLKRAFNGDELEPYAITSCRHRWTMGTPRRAYGGVEDVRWLMFGGEHPWSCEDAGKIAISGKTQHASFSHGNRSRNCRMDGWQFHGLHRPGSQEARSPILTGPGCVWATCFLAALQLRVDYLGGQATERGQAFEPVPEYVYPGA